MNLFFILLILQICFTKSFNFITNSFITYSGYSLLVDLWASKQVEKMKKNECYDCLPENFNLIENKYMISNTSNIIEDIEYRKTWNTFMNLQKNNKKPVPGTYNFLHRNYANNEEKNIMCIARNTIHKLFIRLLKTGSIQIFSNNTIHLNENIILFSFLRINIKWYGHISNNQVNWNFTELICPKKSIKNPKSTKEYSKYAWNITASDDNYILFTKDRNDTNENILYGNL